MAGGIMAGFGPIAATCVDYAIAGLPREVDYAYSGAEFNEAFGPLEVVKLARRRAEARRRRRLVNRARYRRQYINGRKNA